MTTLRNLASPVAAREHHALSGRRGLDAAGMLTIYLVLLLAVPSDVTIGPLNSYGHPSLIFGLVLLVWWLLAALQRRSGIVGMVRQPVRFAYGAFLVLVLVSFAAALLRGQPTDQISPAESAVVRVLSWGGVLLVTLDGIRTMGDIERLVRRLAIAGALLAALGLLQSFTHQTYLDWITSVPGLKYDTSVVVERGGFARAAGTAKHPLEYAVAITGTLPFALTTAINGGFRKRRGRGALLWWIAPALLMLVSLIAVSRSAIIGLVIAIAASLPAMPRRYRWTVIGLGVVAFAGIAIVSPHVLTTTAWLFTNASDDPSAQSRTGALAKLVRFIAPSPAIGTGFGTFLPRYYIFDDEWALLTVELGLLGVAVFGGMIASGLYSTLRVGKLTAQPETVRMARTIAASVLAIAVLFAFFDGLSFPISGGLLFFMLGLCGSVLTVGASDVRLVSWRRRVLVRRSPPGR